MYYQLKYTEQKKTNIKNHHHYHHHHMKQEILLLFQMFVEVYQYFVQFLKQMKVVFYC